MERKEMVWKLKMSTLSWRQCIKSPVCRAPEHHRVPMLCVMCANLFTNVYIFGNNDLDLDLPEESAMGEPAWQGAGQEEGLKIWRIVVCSYFNSYSMLSVDSLFWLAIIISGLILGLRLANERQRYFVTMSLIGWAQTYEGVKWHWHSMAVALN